MNEPCFSDGCGRARCRVHGRVALWAALLGAAAGACTPEPQRPAVAPQPDRIAMFEGSVHLGNGDELAYRAILAPDPSAPGHHIGTIDIPMQALSAATLEHVEFQAGRRIAFALGLPGTPRWRGDVGADGAIACEFRQRAIRLACSMREVHAARDEAPASPGEGAPKTLEH